MVPLHVEPPEVGNGGPFTHKDFVDIYGLCAPFNELRFLET
jgi:hypothetical protein